MSAIQNRLPVIASILVFIVVACQATPTQRSTGNILMMDRLPPGSKLR
jgi:hypothetical protein